MALATRRTRDRRFTREGPPPLAAPDATVLPLLAHPAVAVLLGAALGVGSLLVSRVSARLVTPEDPAGGLARLAVVSSARMLLVVAALGTYFLFGGTGFVPFGIALVSSFLGTLGYEVFRASSAARRSARTS
ncbi:MAG: hypothetical protein Q7W16_01785 [Coriobacteriia bacterium]|nr:hypothetical protein [Coriobacteriia bacterium]